VIVVFDTNVWLKELGLRSPSAAAVRFYMRHKKARLALPEVIRLEVEDNLRERLRSFIESIQESHRQLLAAFGQLKVVVLPSPVDIDTKIQELLKPADVEIVEIPFSLQSARDSFLKTIKKTAPSDKDQQFKDGVLWADCVSLLRDDEVALVSGDKAFYRDRQYVSGLSPVLAAEIAGAGHRLLLFPSLRELLAELRTDVAVDEDKLAEVFLAVARGSIDSLLERNGFALGERLGVDRALYVTENPAALFLEVSIRYKAVDIQGEEERAGILLLRGDGTYDPTQKSFGELRQHAAELTFTLQDGTEQHARAAFAYLGGIGIGHREERYSVRQKIE